MFYNLLNFPSTGMNRTDDYRTFLAYSKPDVFVVNELDSELGADLILNSSLNTNGVSHYQRAAFVDGYDTDNGLFYNSDKLGLVSQLQLGTVLRDISVYRLYYKAPNLTAQTDTIYFWFFSCHLKAGSTDFEQRNLEAQQVKFYLNDIVGQAENIFVGGDFNFYSGFESGSLTLQNSGSIPLVDPEDIIGNWSNNSAYADWHTQSTRTNSVGGGSGGGMDDRFDIIFVSEDVLDNSNGVQYVANSYTPLGQDGNHFNGSINAGFNAAVPDSVADALYAGSDHLPIMMTVALDETAALPETPINYFNCFFDESINGLRFTTNITAFDIVLFDLMGRQVVKASVSGNQLLLPSLSSGVYVWSATSDGQQMSDKIFIP